MILNKNDNKINPTDSLDEFNKNSFVAASSISFNTQLNTGDNQTTNNAESLPSIQNTNPTIQPSNQ